MKRFKEIILTSFFAVALQAAGTDAYEKTLTVIYTDWYPHPYQDAGEAKGFEIEIFRSLMGKMKIGVNFQNLPWKRCLTVMEEGNADAVVSLLKTPEREAFVYFPQENISISQSCLFTKVDSHIDFNGSLETLSPYTKGVNAGFSYGDAFDRAAFTEG